jgi:hypothetical protein
MDDNTIGALVMAALFVTGLTIGSISGFTAGIRNGETEAVKRGFAYYDAKTAAFTWKDANQ